MEQNSFDAIVVGSGMSGGWAAKELTEKGLKTLVLDRGHMVRHPEYPTATKDPWDLPFGNRITQETRKRKYVWSRTGYPTPANELWFTDDLDNPYVEEQPFDWLRAYHVGGRSMHWARQSYRFSPMDFEANAREGVAHFSNDVEGVRGRQYPDAHEHRGLTIELDVGVVILRSKHDVRDIAEADDDATLFLDDQLTEFLRGTKVRIGHQVHRNHRAFRAAERRQVVIPREGITDRRR